MSQQCPRCGARLKVSPKGEAYCPMPNCRWPRAVPSSSGIRIPQLRLPSRKQLIGSAAGATAIALGLGYLAWERLPPFQGGRCTRTEARLLEQKLKPIYEKFVDQVRVASATSRIALPPQISALQETQRQLNSEKWPECAKHAIERLNEGMSETINGFLSFAANEPDLLVQIHINRGQALLSSFRTGYFALVEGRKYRVEDGSALEETLREMEQGLKQQK